MDHMDLLHRLLDCDTGTRRENILTQAKQYQPDVTTNNVTNTSKGCTPFPMGIVIVIVIIKRYN